MLPRKNLFGKLPFFFIRFNLIDFFPVNKQITIITILSQTQAKFCLLKILFVIGLLKLILSLSSGAPKLPLIPKVSPSSNTKKLTSTFLTLPFPKFHSPFPSYEFHSRYTHTYFHHYLFLQ